MPIIVPGEAIRSGEIRDPLAELQYLPMFYLFPVELLVHSEFLNFPRNPHLVYHTPEWRELYHSDKFTETVIDGMAGMIWKHFGIKAPMEDFSGYYPFWILARSGVWIHTAARLGFNTVSMARVSPHFQYPVLSWELAEGVFRQMVGQYRLQHPLNEWITAVQQRPDWADYEPSRRRRRTYQDFLRRWHHSRSKWVKPISVTTGDEWDALHKHDELLKNPYTDVDFRMDYETFMETMGENEQQIVPLLVAGYTQAEVAKHLGYANHSAVNKKVKKIGRKYREHMKIDDRPQKERKAVRWDEMTRLLFPKAKP